MKKFWGVFWRLIWWTLILNGMIALGFVAYNQSTMWLPDYGQSYWWAWGSAFMEAPENILYIVLGLVAFGILYKKRRILL